MSVGVPWTMFMGVVSTLAFLFSERWGHACHRLWAKGACWCVGIRIEVYFPHQIPKSGGYLLACNHESLWDIPVLAALPTNFKWISKRELRAVPFIGWTMRAMGVFWLTRRRSGQDLNVMQEVENGLRNGAHVLIFPEGTRTRTGQLLPFKKGAFRSAQNASVPLVPVAISGTFRIAAPGKLPDHRGHRVAVRFGPPMRVPSGEQIEPYVEKFRGEIVRLLNEETPRK